MSQGSRFCHKCGAALPAGSVFCPICGTPVASTAPGPSTVPPSAPGPSQPQWERRRNEKGEKNEKREKNEKNEKGKGGDLAGALTGGFILVLLGLLFYLAQAGNTTITWGNFWQYFLVGIGAILILQGIIRYAQSKRMFPGTFIGGTVLIIIGLTFVSAANIFLWPLILVVLGLGAIASAFVGRRRAPAP